MDQRSKCKKFEIMQVLGENMGSFLKPWVIKNSGAIKEIDTDK